MQPLLLPDKLLHGYSSLAARQLALPCPQISARYHCARTHTHTHTYTHNLSELSCKASWFICVIIVLRCYCCLFLSLSFPRWSFSETVAFLQQTEGPHNVREGLALSPSPSPLCVYADMVEWNQIVGSAFCNLSVNAK